jgi:hypothetical protein
MAKMTAKAPAVERTEPQDVEESLPPPDVLQPTPTYKDKVLDLYDLPLTIDEIERLNLLAIQSRTINEQINLLKEEYNRLSFEIEELVEKAGRPKKVVGSSWYEVRVDPKPTLKINRVKLLENGVPLKTIEKCTDLKFRASYYTLKGIKEDGGNNASSISEEVEE